MRQRSRLEASFLVIAAVIAAGCVAESSAQVRPRPLQIVTLSNRADLVSGGDAFVEIILPDHAPLQHLKVRVGERDVSSAFARRADGRITGVITGLAVGPNIVTADSSGANAASLTITNHPIGGPVFSRPQPLPFVCAPSVAMPAVGNTPASNASGLSTLAYDAQCNIATEVKLYYRTTTAGCAAVVPDPNPPTAPPANGCFKRFDPALPPPADLAMTTTDAGITVPYI